MTNNERFNRMLNACRYPRAVLAALVALAPAIKEAKDGGQQEALLEALEEGAQHDAE